MSIGVAEPEDAIDERDAVAEVAIDFAAQVSPRGEAPGR
jgi:hypothetical protein